MAQAFERVHFVMVAPSHPGNVGAAARAIKTMGFSHLALVAPCSKTLTAHPDAIALASGAGDILQHATFHASLEEALGPITLAFALTARPRRLGPPPCDIRQAADLACQHLAHFSRGAVAMVMGTERTGLSNAHMAACHRLCYIPANAHYSSLNVAQALQLAAWEMRYTLLTLTAHTPPATSLGAATPPPTEIPAQTATPTPVAAQTSTLPALTPATFTTKNRTDPGAQPASSEALQALLIHWEEALIAIKFLNPQHPKKLMLRLRHLLTRCALTCDEVNMLRGICTAILHKQYGHPKDGHLHLIK